MLRLKDGFRSTGSSCLRSRRARGARLTQRAQPPLVPPPLSRLCPAQIWIANGGGTKENPACVPSQFTQRTLGFDNPATQQLVWFNAKKGELTYVSEIDKYFTLVDP